MKPSRPYPTQSLFSSDSISKMQSTNGAVQFCVILNIQMIRTEYTPSDFFVYWRFMPK